MGCLSLIQNAAVPVPQQEKRHQSAQHRYTGDEEMVRQIPPGGEELAPGHEHADSIQGERRAVRGGSLDVEE